jgi:hypothetical protein
VTREDGSSLFTDFLFYFQLVAATVVVVNQVETMKVSIDGVSVTWFGFWLAFLSINLVLAFNVLKTHQDRVSKQTFFIYVVWTLAIGAVFINLLRQSVQWTEVDSWTTVITGSGIFISLCVARLIGIAYSDPLVRSSFAVFLKAVPQLTLAWNIFLYGGDGLSVSLVIAGHLTIATRLIQVWYSTKIGGWDRNRIGIAVGELANQISWAVATVVWIFVD